MEIEIDFTWSPKLPHNRFHNHFWIWNCSGRMISTCVRAISCRMISFQHDFIEGCVFSVIKHDFDFSHDIKPRFIFTTLCFCASFHAWYQTFGEVSSSSSWGYPEIFGCFFFGKIKSNKANSMGVSIVMGIPKKWMVYMGKYPHLKFRWFGGSPIYGKPHFHMVFHAWSSRFLVHHPKGENHHIYRHRCSNSL